LLPRGSGAGDHTTTPPREPRSPEPRGPAPSSKKAVRPRGPRKWAFARKELRHTSLPFRPPPQAPVALTYAAKKSSPPASRSKAAILPSDGRPVVAPKVPIPASGPAASPLTPRRGQASRPVSAPLGRSSPPRPAPRTSPPSLRLPEPQVQDHAFRPALDIGRQAHLEFRVPSPTSTGRPTRGPTRSWLAACAPRLEKSAFPSTPHRTDDAASRGRSFHRRPAGSFFSSHPPRAEYFETPSQPSKPLPPVRRPPFLKAL